MTRLFGGRRAAAAFVLATLLAPALAHAGDPAETGHGLALENMDRTLKPCENLYGFANGTWDKNTPIPEDRTSWGVGPEVQERNFQLLHSILDEAAATNAPAGSPTQKVGDFYRSGMDTEQIEREGVRPLAGAFKRIDAIKNVGMLQDEMARLHRQSVSAGFNFFAQPDATQSTLMVAWFYQGGLGLPDRDYYTKDDEASKKLRDQYQAHVAKMFQLLGDPQSKAEAEARTILDMETRLAKASMTQVEQRDPHATYNRKTLAELDALTPGLSWARYRKTLGLPKVEFVVVSQPLFFKELGAMMTSTPIADWKTYLRWNLINANASVLNSAIEAQDFAFYGTTLNGTPQMEPRWKRVLRAEDNYLGEALGQLYVAKAFSPQAKERARTLILNVKAALRDRLTTLEWMGEETRQQAIKKLDAITVKVGYPDTWRDYSALKVDRGPYVLNSIRAREFEFQRNLNKIGKPVDRSEWGMTPPTVNAYYDPSSNEIVFPAGRLQPPFFDANADDAVNYGATGTVVGHELTHGFDDYGRQFDADGNLKNWWSEADEKNFTERAERLAAMYDQFVPVDDVHINGHLTLGENLADLGGMKIAYLAFKKSLEGKPRAEPIDGFTPEQRFFLSFAQNWRRKFRPAALRVILATDPHSPPKYRVIGVLKNFPEFYQAFGCSADESKLHEPVVSIW